MEFPRVGYLRLHVGIGDGVDDVLGEVSKGILARLLVVDDLVMILYVDETRAREASSAQNLAVVASVHRSERIPRVGEELCKPGARPVGMAVVIQQHHVVDAELGEGGLLNSVDRRGVLQVEADDRVVPLAQDPVQDVEMARHMFADLAVHHAKLHGVGLGDDDDVIPPLLRGVRH